MQVLYFLLIFLICIHSGQQDCTNIPNQGCNNCCINSQNIIPIITCNITENNITEVNERIRVCINGDRILGMEIIIISPLSGDIRLDMLSNNTFYLAIDNQQQEQSVGLVATENVPNLRTLAIYGIGSFKIHNSTFFSHFIRIEKITMSNTSFFSPPSFSQLYTLTYLSISDTNLSNHSNVYVREEFVGGLAQLKYLLVSSHQSTLSLSDLAFRGLTSLTALYLLNSNIRSISENQFRDSRALSRISLSHNNITFLSSQTFQQLPHLTTVDISDNPLNCSCPLQWMSVAENKFNLKFRTSPCQYPPESAGETATSPSAYRSCPPLSLSLQCLNRSHPLCPPPLSCYDTATNYQCSACPPGYGQVSDSECVAIDACSHVPSPCGHNTTCVNTVGSFLCLYPSNPCDTRNGGCEQKCEFNGSSHWCSCYAGFKFDNDTNTCASDAIDTTYQIKIAYSITGAAVTLFFITWIILIVRQCYLYRGNKYRRLFRRQISKEEGIEMEELPSDEVRIGDMINHGIEHDDDI